MAKGLLSETILTKSKLSVSLKIIFKFSSLLKTFKTDWASANMPPKVSFGVFDKSSILLYIFFQ